MQFSKFWWFIDFTIDFKTGSLINFESGSYLVYSRMFKLLTIFEKKVLKTRAVSLSFPIISSSSVNVIFSEEVILSGTNGLIVFQKHFVVRYIFFTKVGGFRCFVYFLLFSSILFFKNLFLILVRVIFLSDFFVCVSVYKVHGVLNLDNWNSNLP